MSNADEFHKGHSPFSDEDKAVLDFEATPFKHWGAKEQAAYDKFGYSLTRHYQKLNSIINKPEAAAYSPVVVNRVRRQREQNRRNRSAKNLGIDIG